MIWQAVEEAMKEVSIEEELQKMDVDDSCTLRVEKDKAKNILSRTMSPNNDSQLTPKRVSHEETSKENEVQACKSETNQS